MRSSYILYLNMYMLGNKGQSTFGKSPHSRHLTLQTIFVIISQFSAIATQSMDNM